jgi:hypothetical protein
MHQPLPFYQLSYVGVEGIRLDDFVLVSKFLHVQTKSETYWLCHIFASHFKGWQFYVETVLDSTSVHPQQIRSHPQSTYRVEMKEMEWSISALSARAYAATQCGGSGMFILDPGGCLSRIPDPGSDFFHPGSRIRTVSIPDPGSELSPSRIPDPGSASKNLSVLTPKKWFLSSRKYDPGCSSRIPDPDADFYPSRIPDPGVKKAPDPGSGSATLLQLCT